MNDTVELTSTDASLRIATHGAEPLSWQAGGRELLWSGGEAWPRSSPVLFPIIGWAREGRIRVDGRTYPIGVHGFAADEDFVIARHDASSATFTLADNAATRSRYPFSFLLQVTYRLEPRAVSVTFRIANTGDRAMPFAIGLHPGFRWPFAGGDADGYAIVFDKPEHAFVPVIDRNGLFTDRARPIPLHDGRRLALSHDLLAREALCFLDARSEAVRFQSPAGDAIVVETEKFPHLALWSLPPAPFLCIECWTGHGDPDTFDGELANKPSMRHLGPNAHSSHAVRWRFEEKG